MRPDDRLYTKSHEWVKQSGETALIGITDFAVNELCSGNEGDLVYCDLPEVGRVLEANETFGEIESVKAVADLNTPVAGTVAEVNPAIEEHLEILSKDPFDAGWMVKLTLKSKTLDSDLMDAAAYESFLSEGAHS
ncbi:MAG: glycine cleavage system protein GcvH [Planctomycetota bacterium]